MEFSVEGTKDLVEKKEGSIPYRFLRTMEVTKTNSIRLYYPKAFEIRQQTVVGRNPAAPWDGIKPCK